jgi:Ca2+-binding RTX toxin-like protein
MGRRSHTAFEINVVAGRGTPDSLVGSPGNDVIRGLAGDDTLDGLAGCDILIGNAGDDLLSGGDGDDLVLGGSGNDELFGNGTLGPVPPFGGSVQTSNLILAGAGDDSVAAGYGTDVVFGGAGDDTILGFGTSPASATEREQFKRLDGGDLLSGDSGADSIDGGGGADTILGGPGDDVLIGSYDADALVGGADADRFVFRLLGAGPPTTPDTGVGEGARDVVRDFQQGQDVLDLSGYRNPAGASMSPIFLGTGEFIATFELQVRYEILEDGRTLVQFDTTLGRFPGDVEPTVPTEPMGEIVLAGRFQLSAQDFIL